MLRNLRIAIEYIWKIFEKNFYSIAKSIIKFPYS